MEPIPEDASPIHFFKLLALLSRNNNVRDMQIHLKPPNTLILGFAFSVPTLMHVKQHRLQFTPVSNIVEVVSNLEMYAESEREDLPRFIVKRTKGTLFLRSSEELEKVWSNLNCCSGEDVLIQPFIISKSHKARLVEVLWDSLRGVSSSFLQNSSNLCLSDISTLTLNPHDADPTPASTSLSTQHLHDTIDTVKTIIEKAAFRGDRVRVRHVRIRMLQDITDNWFFLGIESFSVERLRASPELLRMWATTDSLRRTLTLRSSLPATSMRSVPLSPNVSSFRGKSDSHTSLQSPYKPKGCQKNYRSKTMMSTISSTNRCISRLVYPQAYLKELEIEAEVSKLIAKDEHTSIANVTYKSWKKRVSESKKLLLVDKIYAKKICRKRRTVMAQSAQTLKNLQKFREMITLKTDEMVYQEEIADRISGKVPIDSNGSNSQTVRFRI